MIESSVRGQTMTETMTEYNPRFGSQGQKTTMRFEDTGMSPILFQLLLV